MLVTAVFTVQSVAVYFMILIWINCVTKMDSIMTTISDGHEKLQKEDFYRHQIATVIKGVGSKVKKLKNIRKSKLLLLKIFQGFS